MKPFDRIKQEKPGIALYHDDNTTKKKTGLPEGSPIWSPVVVSGCLVCRQ